LIQIPPKSIKDFQCFELILSQNQKEGISMCQAFNSLFTYFPPFAQKVFLSSLMYKKQGKWTFINLQYWVFFFPFVLI